MIAGLFLAAALAGAEPLTDRIRESAAAAQALQGPLSGAWVLRGRNGAVRLELSAPPGEETRASGAWRDGKGRFGFATAERRGDRLTLRLGARLMTFRRRADGRWVGDEGRSLARAKPPV